MLRQSPRFLSSSRKTTPAKIQNERTRKSPTPKPHSQSSAPCKRQLIKTPSTSPCVQKLCDVDNQGGDVITKSKKIQKSATIKPKPVRTKKIIIHDQSRATRRTKLRTSVHQPANVHTDRQGDQQKITQTATCFTHEQHKATPTGITGSPRTAVRKSNKGRAHKSSVTPVKIRVSSHSPKKSSKNANSNRRVSASCSPSCVRQSGSLKRTVSGDKVSVNDNSKLLRELNKLTDYWNKREISTTSVTHKNQRTRNSRKSDFISVIKIDKETNSTSSAQLCIEPRANNRQDTCKMTSECKHAACSTNKSPATRSGINTANSPKSGPTNTTMVKSRCLQKAYQNTSITSTKNSNNRPESHKISHNSPNIFSRFQRQQKNVDETGTSQEEQLKSTPSKHDKSNVKTTCTVRCSPRQHKNSPLVTDKSHAVDLTASCKTPERSKFIQNAPPNMEVRYRSLDGISQESNDGAEYFVPRRKKLRSEVKQDELWDGFPLSVCFKRLVPKQKEKKSEEASVGISNIIQSDIVQKLEPGGIVFNSKISASDKKPNLEAKLQNFEKNTNPEEKYVKQKKVPSLTEDSASHEDIENNACKQAKQTKHHHDNDDNSLYQHRSDFISELNRNASDVYLQRENGNESTVAENPRQSKRLSSSRKRKCDESNVIKRSSRLQDKSVDSTDDIISGPLKSSETACNTGIQTSAESSVDKRAMDEISTTASKLEENGIAESDNEVEVRNTSKSILSTRRGDTDLNSEEQTACDLENKCNQNSYKGKTISTSEFSIDPVIYDYNTAITESSTRLLEKVFQHNVNDGADDGEKGNSEKITVMETLNAGDLNRDSCEVEIKSQSGINQQESQIQHLKVKVDDVIKTSAHVDDVIETSVHRDKTINNLEQIDVTKDSRYHQLSIANKDGVVEILPDDKKEKQELLTSKESSCVNLTAVSPKPFQSPRRGTKLSDTVNDWSWKTSARVVINPLKLGETEPSTRKQTKEYKKSTNKKPAENGVALSVPKGSVKHVPSLRIKLKTAEPSQHKGVPRRSMNTSVRRDTGPTITVELTNKPDSSPSLCDEQDSDLGNDSSQYLSEDPFLKSAKKSSKKSKRTPKRKAKGTGSKDQNRSSASVNISPKLRLNNERRLSEAESLLSNPVLNKHACVIWSSEHRRHLQMSHPEATLTEIDATLSQRWDKLEEKERLRYFQRARNAIRDENRHSSHANSKHKDICRSSSESRVADTKTPSKSEFEALDSAHQLKELERWLHFFHEVSPEEYTRCMDAFKQDLSLEKEKGYAPKKSSKRKSKVKTKGKRCSKQEAKCGDADSHARYRRLLFQQILKSSDRVIELFREKREMQRALFRDNYNRTVKKLISGRNVIFPTDVRSRKLTEVLHDIQILEEEELLSVSGTSGPSKTQCVTSVPSLEALATSLMNESDNFTLTTEQNCPETASGQNETGFQLSKDLRELEDVLVQTADGALPELDAFSVQQFMSDINTAGTDTEITSYHRDSGHNCSALCHQFSTACFSPSHMMTDWVVSQVQGSVADTDVPPPGLRMPSTSLVSVQSVDVMQTFRDWQSQANANNLAVWNLNQNCNPENAVKSSKYLKNFRSFSKQVRESERNAMIHSGLRSSFVTNSDIANTIPLARGQVQSHPATIPFY